MLQAESVFERDKREKREGLSGGEEKVLSFWKEREKNDFAMRGGDCREMKLLCWNFERDEGGMYFSLGREDLFCGKEQNLASLFFGGIAA